MARTHDAFLEFEYPEILGYFGFQFMVCQAMDMIISSNHKILAVSDYL